ncbi:MAG: DUF4333 domain-containing protein [Myxococcales bacterium]|nr:DUF4333 domain-containing protein [Myxococcales bacterium]
MRQRPSTSSPGRGFGLAHLVLPIVIGGCSFQASCGGKTIDSKKGEAIITERLKADTGLEAKATCPTGIKIKKGGTFDCTIELGGVKGKVLVTQNDESGNVSFAITEGFIIGAKVEAAIAANLKENGLAATGVSCGAAVRPSVPGTFTCTAQVPDQALTIEVTIKNQTGSIDWKVLPPTAPPPTAEPAEGAAPTEGTAPDEGAAPGEPPAEPAAPATP